MAEPHVLKLGSGILTHICETDDHGDQQEKQPATKDVEKSHHLSKSVEQDEVPAASWKATQSGDREELDLELVTVNAGFTNAAYRDASDIELHREPSLTEISLDPNEPDEVSHDDDDCPGSAKDNVIERLAQLYAFEHEKERLRSLEAATESTESTLSAALSSVNTNFAGAIYSEDAVSREDTLSFDGYTVRTQGADLCINSIRFNQDGNKLSLVIKTAQYDQFYGGTVSRVKSEPKVIVEPERWAMLYGGCEDDSLGILEIELPPGAPASEIRYEDLSNGLISISIPERTKAEVSQVALEDVDTEHSTSRDCASENCWQVL